MRPSRDPNSNAYPGRTFHRGRWSTPEMIENQRRLNRESNRRCYVAKPSNPSGYLDKDGYRRVKADGTPYEHRLVMATRIGRAIAPEERVHHVNDDKADNRPENLWLWPDNAAHTAWHEMRRHGHELQVTMAAVPLSAEPVAL